MITPEQNDLLIKMFISVGTNANSSKSLTSIIGELSYLERINSISLKDLTDDDIESLRLQCISERTNLAEEIGVTVPEEKKFVMDVLGSANLNIFDEPSETIRIVNETLAKNKLTFQLEPTILPSLRTIIGKARILYRGLNNLKLYSVKRETMDIAEYYKKYLTIPKGEVLKRIEYLKSTYSKILDNCLEPQTMINIAVDALTRFNHLPFTMANKDPQELLRIVFYEQLAAEGTLNALDSKPGQSISENDVKDGIARILAEMKFGY